MDRAPAPETQTPDMQTATGQMPQPSLTGPSIISALQSIQGPNPMLAGASAALNTLGGGRPGDNPYLAQNQVAQHGMIQQINQVRLAQEADLHRQVQLQAMQQRMQEHALKRDDAARTVTRDLLFGPHALEDEGQRAVVAKQYAGFMSKLGIPMNDSIMASWAKGGPSQDSQKQLALQLAAADAELDPASKGVLLGSAQKFYLAHGGKPEDFQTVAQNLRNPAYLEATFKFTPDDLKTKALDLQKKEADAITRQFPELVKGDPATIQDMIMQHRKISGGKTWQDGTDESRNRAYNLAKYNQAKVEEAKIARQLEMRSILQQQQQQFSQGQLDQRLAAQDTMLDKRLATAAQSAAKKKDEAVKATAESFLNQFKAIVPQMYDEGFLPRGTDFISSKAAMLRRGIDPENPVLREWFDLQANMIGWARSVQNDIGPRAMAAFHETNRVMSQPPTKEGLERIIKNMEAQLTASKTQEVQSAPNAKGPMTPPGGIQAEYNALRKGGMSAEQAKDALKKRGYTID